MSWDLYKIIFAFKDKSIYNELMNPNENKRKLEEYFSITPGSQSEIHIHNPGDTYNDASMSFIADGIESNQLTFLVKSGLYQLGNIPDINPEFGADSMLSKIRTRPTIAYTKEVIKSVYNGSIIFPRNLEDEYASMEDFKSKNLLSIRVSNLMELYPGIYYNFSCRVACNDEIRSLTRFRRNKSAEAVINVVGKPARTSVQEREGPNPILQGMLDVWLHDKIRKLDEYEEETRIEKERIQKQQIEKQRRKRNLYKKLRVSRRATAKKSAPRGPKASKRSVYRTRRKSSRRSPPPMAMNNT